MDIMNKEKKTHIIYGSILAVVILATFLYHGNTIKSLKNYVASQDAEISQQLSNTKTELGASIEQLKAKDAELSKALEEKDKTIKSLSGEFEQLKVESAQQLTELQDKITNLKLQNQDFSEVIDKAIPSVVSIQTNRGIGSGFIARSNGYIVTNYHVINGINAAVIVTSDGSRHSVSLAGYNENADIAVLKIEGTFDRIRFGDSDNVKVGEKVIAVGSPAGLDFTVTQGIVSAVNRKDDIGNTYIQIDVPINPGNSGGPLVNAAGEVIGVTTSKQTGFESLGFALAANNVDSIADGLIAQFEQGQ